MAALLIAQNRPGNLSVNASPSKLPRELTEPTEHHRYLLAFHLRRIEAIEADLRTLDKCIEEAARPYVAQRQLLRQIPGVDDRIAVAIIAEIGIDMTVFGNAERLAAWAGVCPGNHESAGNKKHATTRKGNIHLKTTLVQAAVCAARTKDSYYKDKYHRLKARRGAHRAAMAIAHKILVAVFHMLAKTIPFKEFGEAFLDQQASKRTTTNLVRRLNNLRYHVLLRPKVGRMTTCFHRARFPPPLIFGTATDFMPPLD